MPTTTSQNLGHSARQWRRRSADVGGLHLATGNSGQGQGWIGYSGELQYVTSPRMPLTLGEHFTAPNSQNS